MEMDMGCHEKVYSHANSIAFGSAPGREAGSQPISQLVRQAGRQTLRARNGFHPDRAAWASTRAILHSQVRSIVGRPGSGYALLRRHAWRRYGAAQLHMLGAPTPAILLWGGWASPQMLRVYAYPQGNWEFHSGGPLVTPLDLEARELG